MVLDCLRTKRRAWAFDVEQRKFAQPGVQCFGRLAEGALLDMPGAPLPAIAAAQAALGGQAEAQRSAAKRRIVSPAVSARLRQHAARPGPDCSVSSVVGRGNTGTHREVRHWSLAGRTSSALERISRRGSGFCHGCIVGSLVTARDARGPAERLGFSRGWAERLRKRRWKETRLKSGL